MMENLINPNIGAIFRSKSFLRARISGSRSNLPQFYAKKNCGKLEKSPKPYE